MLRQRPLRLLGLCLLGMLAVACQSAKSILLTEQEEFSLAQQYMEAKKWDKARLHFQRISDRYPGSALASEAILGKAESFFQAEQFAEAQTEYQLFVEFYPAHEKADLAQFRIGLCQSENIRAIDRDQTPTIDSVKTFQTFLQNYPKSSLVPEATQRLKDAKERLKRHDIYVAKFYQRKKAFLSTAVRYKKVLDGYELTEEERTDIAGKLETAWAKFAERRLEYVDVDFPLERWFAIAEAIGLLRHYRPDHPMQDRHQYFYAESLYQLKRLQDSKSEFESLIQRYPDSQYVAKAKERITELQAGSAPTPTTNGNFRP